MPVFIPLRVTLCDLVVASPRIFWLLHRVLYLKTALMKVNHLTCSNSYRFSLSMKACAMPCLPAGVEFSTAVSNGLDLRPATAFQDASQMSLQNGSQQDGETKEVDLASLSAQLFSYHNPVASSSIADGFMQPNPTERPASANLWAKSTSKKNIHLQRESAQHTGTEVTIFLLFRKLRISMHASISF